MAEEPRKPPDSAAALLRRYAEGEREFSHARLDGANLAGANLSAANLSGANLAGAHLRGANLSGANLSGATVDGANLEYATLMGATLSDASVSDANLDSANLTDANLSGVDLIGVRLTLANIDRANLSGAWMMNADLSRANLFTTRLVAADLSNANLADVDLSCANLSEADLSGANLCGARLDGAIADGARLGNTLLLDLDLSPFCDAAPSALHSSSSFIDFRSVLKSVRCPNLKSFLQKTGMPEIFVEYDVSCAESLNGSIIRRMLQSTFISYGSPDEPFARKLYEALHRNGVTTFFFAEHAVPGDKLHRMMRTKVNEYDRVILVCSKASLDRKGVLNEIEETLTREARDGGAAYLIPIRLDSYVFSGWAPANPDTAQAVRDRVVADFEGADGDSAKFDAGLLRLIAALKK